jgi:hypothetical protein
VFGELRRLLLRPLGGDKREVAEVALLEQLGRLRQRAATEADQALAVTPGEALRGQGVGAFLASCSSTRSASETALSRAVESARR